MTDQKYTDTEQYQKEIAQQYKERVSKFTPEQVLEVLRILGLPNLPAANEITEATAGNVNATYVTPELVVKVNQGREHPDYLANKIVSDKLADKWPVVKVLAYDNFEKTDFEALVMEKAKGTMLLEDVFELSEEDQIEIFRQMLEVVRQLFEVKFKDFGWINYEGKKSFRTYAAFLKAEFDEYVKKIRDEHLAEPEDIEQIEAYFNRHIGVFDEGEPVFVHTDLHMGNMLHEGKKLTAVLDFDWSLKAPKERVLLSLLGLIDNPSQFVEGTRDFPKYKGKNFYHLLPVLKQEFPEIFADPQLLRKLNLIGLSEGVMWISQNWSTEWNKEQLKRLTTEELPEEELTQTYHGKILSH